MHEGGKHFRKNINIGCSHNYSLGRLSGSTGSYVSGNNTSEIVHLTKGSCIIESNIAIKTCLTASEGNIERRGFKLMPIYPILHQMQILSPS